MENLPLTWEEIEGYLRGIEGFNPTLVKRYFQEDAGPEGIHFFKIAFERGEVIVPKDGYSDYAALHLQGKVWVSEEEPSPPALPECWDAPGPWRRALAATWLGRYLERFLPRPAGEHAIAAPHEPAGLAGNGAPQGIPVTVWVPQDGPPHVRDVADRFMGVTSVVWNQPRSVTLLADDDDGKRCEMLLIKRKALVEIVARAPQFYQRKVRDFFKQTLPRQLANNRLFRSIFYVEEVQDWDALLTRLGGTDSPAVRRLRELWKEGHLASLEGRRGDDLDDLDRYRFVCELNELLSRRDLHTPEAWAPASLPAEEQGLLERGIDELTANERSRLNRFLIEAAFPGAFRSLREFRPLALPEFEDLVNLIVQESPDLPQPVQPRPGKEGTEVICEPGKPAESFYFILKGRLRVTRDQPGGTMVLNHLKEEGFFGESCLDEGTPTHGARVEALTHGTLLKLDRAVMKKLAEAWPWVGERLRHERARSKRRDASQESGRRMPPPDPPQAVAARLQRTTNLLLIDMERCTRCDQCVQACATAHQGRPRFHRANPDLRFGKWEVAGACLHCTDAPCLEACPVGAITFLDTGAVQIHRNRCIGCTKCAVACPFGVVDMYPPLSRADGASIPEKKWNTDEDRVATKCDLCLARDRQPPCVIACPYGAAMRATPEEFFPGLQGWAPHVDPALKL